jgi:SAM-dependent methyltransferase
MNDKPADRRDGIYRNLHGGQLESDEEKNRHAGRVILRLLFGEFLPKSVVDIGCGLGTWLSVARELGVRDITGVDGSWLEKSRLRIPEHLVRVLDLEKPFDLERRFDLAICIEVAEHLDEKAARGFVGSLTSHSDIILFSAAMPFQGGDHHVNEQWPDYWRDLFMERGFQILDVIRGHIWTDPSIHLWLRQNLFLFVAKSVVERGEVFRALSGHPPPLSVVHPEVYLIKLQQAQTLLEDYRKVQILLAGGGNFNVRREADGRITITRDEGQSPVSQHS